ncbi:uncharacterized protein LOC108674117 [Hyalella azteca]|uniref:Uncharacterized protein LOC108674117 n=1 Tax=Hyalella azteca TaxID=294128 RepID=A0A8B7NXA0_HYAAZ|nr:uncharacterized protein LOC108674117 [Hyalella azteca]
MNGRSPTSNPKTRSPLEYLRLIKDWIFEQRSKDSLSKQSNLFDEMQSKSNASSSNGTKYSFRENSGNNLQTDDVMTTKRRSTRHHNVTKDSKPKYHDKMDLQSRESQDSDHDVMNSSFSSEVSVLSVRRQLFSDNPTGGLSSSNSPPAAPLTPARVTKERGGAVSPESGLGDEASSWATNTPCQFVSGEFFSFHEDDPNWNTPRKISESTRRLSHHQPQNHYIAYTSDQELQEWSISPRTDYTYSASVSYRTHSPRKRVGSPNMSRRPLHTTLPSHPLPSDEEHQVLREGISLQQFYDGRAIRRTEASSESATLSVNFGLDHESDGEDLAPARSSNKRKHLSHRATPLLASNSLTANHASSLLSTPNGGSLFSHNECSPFPKGRTTFEGIVDALSYTAQQLVRTPTVLKNTVMSFTYSQASRYDVGANDIHYNKNNTTLVDSHTKTKTISTTADSWLHENNHRTTTTTTNTSRSGSVNRSSMVLRSRRRVGATAGTDEEEQVEFFENTQNQRLDSTDGAMVQSPSSPESHSSFLYTLLAVIVWATSASADAVHRISKRAISTSYSATSSAAKGLLHCFYFTRSKDASNLVDESEHATAAGSSDEPSTRKADTEIMDDPADSSKDGWLSWLFSCVPIFGGKRRRRMRRRRQWDEHGMDTRSKARRNRIGSSNLTVDDIAEHDYANDDDDEHVQTSYVTSTFTSVITTVFETIYDISFEIEEAARKIIGVASRREEREKEKRLRLSKSGDEIFTDGRNSNSVFGGDNHETDVYADDESSSAASWCFWMVPLLLLIAFVALSGWSYLYHSENLKDAVTSSAAYVTSTTITVTSVVWDWIFSVFFLLIDFGKLILWAITYPFVYIYSSGAEALGRMTSGKWSLTSDLGTSSGDTGAFGVVSVVRSAFSSVLSFCLWVFSGVSELLLYIWSLLLSLLSYSESVVTSSCSTAAANVSSFMLAGTEGLWSALLWVWGVIGVVIGSALSLVAIVFNAVTGLAQSAKIMFVASPSSKIPAPRPEVPLIKSEVPPLIENNVAMIDDLVARVLQSEQLQLQLGSKVSSEVAEQTAPTAAKLEQLQLSSSAVQTENRDLLLQLQRYHDSLKQELLQLQESLAAVAADGREGRTVLSAAVQEQLQQVEEHIKQFQQNFKDINHQINKLQDDQSLLSAELKSCCQKTALSLADVESHVVGLISSLIGGSSGSLSSEDLKAWIATYFVAKDQMEERINDLMSQIKSRTDVAPESSRLQEETLVQTQQLVMERVMETLQTRLHEHDQRVTSGIRETVVAHLESDQIKDLLVSHLDSDQVKEHLEAHLKADQVKDHIEAHLKSNQVKDLLISHLDSDEIKEHLESRLKSDQVKDILVSHLDSDRVKDHIETHLKSDQVKNLLISHLDSDQAKDNIVTHLKSEQVIDRLLLELQPILEERLKNSQEITTENAREAVEIETAARSVELNDTVNALVAAAIALHMKSESGSEKTSEALRTAAGVAMGGVGGDAFNQLALSRHEVEVLVTDALRKYDADRTGLVDHALESGGGSIVSTRCTEAYETIQAEVSILGIPLYRYATNTPRSIIQPDRHPGQCWAFKGSQGFVVIRLVAPVRPTGFTLEHIPKSIAPFGVIDSAPKNFSMWGLMTENDEGVLIGAYQYRDDGEPLQYFAVDEVPVDFFPFIELKIDSNHGNMKYTCVYRVRVHGIRMKL